MDCIQLCHARQAGSPQPSPGLDAWFRAERREETVRVPGTFTATVGAFCGTTEAPTCFPRPSSFTRSRRGAQACKARAARCVPETESDPATAPHTQRMGAFLAFFKALLNRHRSLDLFEIVTLDASLSVPAPVLMGQRGAGLSSVPGVDFGQNGLGSPRPAPCCLVTTIEVPAAPGGWKGRRLALCHEPLRREFRASRKHRLLAASLGAARPSACAAEDGSRVQLAVVFCGGAL